MKTILLCATILAVACAIGWKQHQQLAGINRDNALLKASLRQIESIKQRRAKMSAASVSTNDLQRLRAEHLELMRMRAEIGRLHEAQKIDLPQIQKEVEAIEAQAAVTKQRGNDLTALREADIQSGRMVQAFAAFMHGIVFPLAASNGRKFPTSRAEIEMLMNALPPEKRARLAVVDLDRSFALFEFIPYERRLTLDDPPMLLLREKSPRPMPDGGFARYYGFSDKHVEEARVPTANFANWESEHRPQTKP